MDADGLGLVLAVVSLHADEVGVCSLVKAGPNGQHMLVGLIQSLHELTRTGGHKDEDDEDNTETFASESFKQVCLTSLYPVIGIFMQVL